MPQPALPDKPLLNDIAAAKYVTERFGVRVSALTLRKWRAAGREGPSVTRFGRLAYYAETDLDAWVASRLSRTEGATASELAEEGIDHGHA